jgi:hypothetical protein
MYTCYNLIVNQKGDLNCLVREALIYDEKLDISCSRTEGTETART